LSRSSEISIGVIGCDARYRPQAALKEVLMKTAELLETAPAAAAGPKTNRALHLNLVNRSLVA